MKSNQAILRLNVELVTFIDSPKQFVANCSVECLAIQLHERDLEVTFFNNKLCFRTYRFRSGVQRHEKFVASALHFEADRDVVGNHKRSNI